MDLAYEVRDLTVIPMDGEILISWVEPTEENNYSHTTLFMGQVSTFNKDLQRFEGDLASARTLITNLENGAEYTFLIATVDRWGNESQGLIRRATPMDSIKPNEVSDFRAEKGQGKILLSWTNPSDPDFVKSEVWATDHSGTNIDHLFVNGSPGQASSIEIARLENGYNYNFFVKAVDKWGNSSKIAYIAANPDGTPTQKAVVVDAHFGKVYDEKSPSELLFHYYLPPVSNVADHEEGQQILLKWTNPADADFSHIELWVGLEGMSKKLHHFEDSLNYQILDYHDPVEQTRPKSCSYLMKGLENGRRYNFTFSALDKVGNSNDENLKKVIPRDGVAPRLNFIDAAAGNAQILVNWERGADKDFDRQKLFYILDTAPLGTLEQSEIDAAIDYESVYPDSLQPAGTLLDGLVNGQNYFIRLDLYDTSGNCSRFYYDTGAPGADPILPSGDLAPDVLSPRIQRDNGSLTMTWVEPRYIEDATGLNLTDKPPQYLVYMIAQPEGVSQSLPAVSDQPADPGYYNPGADGLYGTADDVGFGSIYQGAVKWFDKVSDGAAADPVSLISDYRGGLTNGTRYIFKVFVVGVRQSDGKRLFSSGRVASQIPDLPASSLNSPDSVEYNGQNRFYDIPMRYLPAGDFEMGVTFFAEEVHEVSLTEGFWIGENEVSYGLWRTVYEWALQNGYQFGNEGAVCNGVEAIKDIPVASAAGNHYTPSGLAIHPAFDRLPVVYINWYDAVVWCNALTEMTGNANNCVYRILGGNRAPIRDSRLSNRAQFQSMDYSDTRTGYRLPTEAQWEYAARYVEDADHFVQFMPGTWVSADYSFYINPVSADPYSWHKGNSGGNINVVSDAVRSTNFVGCYNMSGNVSEWCWDWYDDYTKGLQVDPKGPEIPGNSLNVKVNRGGSYVDVESAQGSAFRGLQQIDRPDLRIGFRVARTK